MAGVKSLIGLALTGSTGMTLLILACTLHEQIWWPAIIIVFYLACPFPLLISRRISSDQGGFSGQTNPAKEWAFFLTTGIVISAFALPILMCRHYVIGVANALLSLASSTFFFATILAFFIVFQSSESSSGLY